MARAPHACKGLIDRIDRGAERVAATDLVSVCFGPSLDEPRASSMPIWNVSHRRTAAVAKKMLCRDGIHADAG